ncbi:MAG: histidine phosphatase family protein [Hyphomicrobiales bacterium]|nr:histidine phosphatase family protein [Hyphomicrobiales bacterium]
MNRLYLLRHAKAGWAEPGTRDFDRPLTERGRRDAAAVGMAMRVSGFVPDLVLCSTARRARETWECVAGTIGPLPSGPAFADSLYSCDAAGYLSIVRNAADGMASLLVIGHNPMIEDVAVACAAEGDEAERAALASGFPTSALAVIQFSRPLAEAEPGGGYLTAFLTPAML